MFETDDMIRILQGSDPLSVVEKAAAYRNRFCKEKLMEIVQKVGVKTLMDIVDEMRADDPASG